jgi:PAS domain S-box-containing protein/putative nucleotidyltransferase with HDIG domain
LRKVNFKFKIFTYFAIAAILPSVLLWYFIYDKIDQKLMEDYKKSSYDYVLNYINEIDNFFQKQEDILESVAQAYIYMDKSPESVSGFLKNQTALSSDFLNLYVIKPDGELISSNGEIIKDEGYTRLKAYTAASLEGQTIWLEPYIDEISGFEAIGIATPVTDAAGKMDGVIIANLSYDFFERTIKRIEYLSDSEIFLIDSSGNIKFSGSDKYSKFKNIRDEGFILQSASNAILYMSQGKYDIEYEGDTWLCTFLTPSVDYLKIIAITDARDFLKNVSSINGDIYSSITVFGIIMLLLVGLLSFILSNSISQPLLLLRDGVKELALGNLEHTITIDSNDEISEVADTFNQMSYNLKKSYQDLFSRTEELYEKNENLQEMNTELEASYEQLGATMEQLNESEEKYRKLVNNISDGVIVLNSNSEVVYVNSTVRNILAQSEAQLIGKNIRDILRGELNEATLEACYNNDYHEFQLKIANFGKKVLYFEGSTRRLVEDESVVGIQAIVRDITQRKTMEDQLRAKYNELQALNNVSAAATGTLNLEEQLDIVVSQLIKTTDTLCTVIALFDEKNPGDLVVRAAKGIRLDDKSYVNVDATKENTASIAQGRKPFIIEVDNEEKLPNEYFRLLYREEGARFVLFTPLIAHDRLIGIMSNHMRNRPAEELVNLISSIGSSVALSIDNARAYKHVKNSYLKTVQSLVSAIEAKDIYTESHSIRVAKYATFIASEMKLGKHTIENIWIAGVLHDIGKIGISDTILHKKDKLTPEEYDLVKQHPVIAYKILSNIGLDESIMYAVRHHHEKHDGKGYPDGISGDEISLMAAIISAADSFDAMTSERSYREPRTIDEGIAELRDCKGTQFNPEIVEVFERAYVTKPEVFYKIYNNEEIRFF